MSSEFPSSEYKTGGVLVDSEVLLVLFCGADGRLCCEFSLRKKLLGKEAARSEYLLEAPSETEDERLLCCCTSVSLWLFMCPSFVALPFVCFCVALLLVFVAEAFVDFES